MRATELSGLRRQPVQARSRARVAQILRAASRLLERDGAAALTMRHLSQEAGVPIGSVYQFFEDRSAVIDAIAARHSSGLRPVLDRAAELMGVEPWPQVIDSVFDTQTERLRGNPAYVELWVGRELSQSARRRDDQNLESVADLLCRMISVEEDVPVTPELRSGCRVVTQMGDALLQLAFRQDRTGNDDTLVEAKRVMRLYLTDLVARVRADNG